MHAHVSANSLAIFSRCTANLNQFKDKCFFFHSKISFDQFVLFSNLSSYLNNRKYHGCLDEQLFEDVFTSTWHSWLELRNEQEELSKQEVLSMQSSGMERMLSIGLLELSNGGPKVLSKQ
jgi:hypothetical protein